MSSPAPLPRYSAICEMLIRDIASGRLTDGERLPPEREMAQELGVAIGTLRKALGALADRGLIRRVQGSGNYVCGRPVVDNAYAFFRLVLPEGGGLPTARILDVTYLPRPTTEVASGTHSHAHRIRRLRFLSGRPAALEEIWLDAAHERRFEADELAPALYLFYRQALGIGIAGAEDRIGLATLPSWVPKDFGKTAGTSLPHICRSAWDGAGRIVETSQSWINPDNAHYAVRMK